MLSELGLKESPLYFYNGLAFVLSWLFVRLFTAVPAGVYLIRLHWVDVAALPLWRAIAYVGFFGVGVVLNSFWGYKLVSGAVKIVMGSAHPKED